MEKKSSFRKKFIGFLAKIYVFFKVVNSKPKYKRFFIGLLIVILAAILIPVGVHIYSINKDKGSSSKTADVTEYVNDDSDKAWYELIDVDFDSLQEVNEDVVAWIYFENEDISYPILYSGDDEYYLHRNLLQETQTAGSIFLEAQNSTDFNDRHTLIYGHNMKNGSMFGNLKNYKNDGYYDDHQYFQIILKDQDTGYIVKYRYHIFAYKDVSDEDEIYYALDQGYSSIASFAVNNIKNGNLLKADSAEEINNDDYIITLSTCSSSADRFVVSAVRCATCSIEE